MADETLRLYIDFHRNSETLEKSLRKLLERYRGRLLPGCPEGRNPLEYLVQTLFREELAGQYFFSNTTVKEGFFYLTLRPRLTPRIEREMPSGVMIAVCGYPTPPGGFAQSLVVESLLDIADSEARTFEVEHRASPVTSEEGLYHQRWTNPLVTPQFLKELPPISLRTRDRLKDWRDCLDWMRRMTYAKVAGLRYINRAIRDGRVQFRTVARTGAEIDDFVQRVRKEDLAAGPMDYSKDPWTFQLKEEWKGRTFRLGAIAGVGRTETISQSNPAGGAPQLAAAEITVSLTEADIDRLEFVPEDAQELAGAIPPQGFLALSMGGDLAQIFRQARAMDEFAKQSGYAPFLSSYLFDMNQAQQVGPRDTQSWGRRDLTEDQQKAVRSILAARDIHLIQGPPGTGKTTVIAEAAFQLASEGRRVLIASQANTAVNNALKRLEGAEGVYAVRLGDSSREETWYSEDRALASYYRRIARRCEDKFLKPWMKLEARQRELKTWLTAAEVVAADLAEAEASAVRADQEAASARRGRDEALAALESARNANEARTALRRNLSRFADALEGKSDAPFLASDDFLDEFYVSVVEPLLALKRASFDVGILWMEKRGDTCERRSLFVLDTLKRRRELFDLKNTFMSDLARLRQLSGESVQTPELWMEITRKKARQRELDSDLTVENLPEWRALKADIGRLERSGQGLPVEPYDRIFPGVRLSSPDCNRQHAIAVLESALRTIGEFEARVDSALVSLAGTARTRAAGVRNEVEDPEAVAKAELHLRKVEVAGRDAVTRRDGIRSAVAEAVGKLGPLVGRSISRGVEDFGHHLAWVRGAIEDDTAALRAQAPLRDALSEVLTDWTKLLNDESTCEKDRERVLPQYIASCNVVGITCNENRRTLDEAGHANFDLVIIDEVSKATPPELLQPMMLARTTVLVGDHRQLPPLFREKEGSWEDAVHDAEENGEDRATQLTWENFKRYEKLITSSHFKERFEEAPDGLKITLTTQFRMHPQIMDVVNPFYFGRLTCGLEEPDAARAHGMTLKSGERAYVRPEDHAVWIDSSRDPTGKPSYETQSDKSKVNDLEAILIAKALDDIDQECARLGFDAHRRPKDVGVITFYLHQKRRIQQAMRNHRAGRDYAAIRPVVSTVHLFQGEERPIVLVSLVRNKAGGRKSAKAYVAQYQLINVAFSRAQELLIIVGAQEMFRDYPVELPRDDSREKIEIPVYREIIDVIHQGGRFWEAARVMTAAEHARAMAGLGRREVTP